MKMSRIIAVVAVCMLVLGCAGANSENAPSRYTATVSGFTSNSDFVPRPAEVREIALSIIALGEYSSVHVTGHTDNVEERRGSANLSVRRARRVANMLIDEGVPAEKIVVVGRGSREPVISNSTPGDRARNRRVEIVVMR